MFKGDAFADDMWSFDLPIVTCDKFYFGDSTLHEFDA